MKYDVELVNCKGRLLIAQKISELLGCSLSQAREYVEKMPCIILKDVDEDAAKAIYESLKKTEAEVNLISQGKVQDSYIPVTDIKPKEVYSRKDISYANDRERLTSLWSEYDRYNRKILHADEQIKKCKEDIGIIEREIKDLEKEIETNRKIKATNGECLRPKVAYGGINSCVSYAVEKGFYCAMVIAVVAFVGMLVLSVVAQEALENAIDASGIPGGIFVWIGSPVIGIIAGIVIAVVLFFVRIVVVSNDNIKKRKENIAFNVSEGLNKAKEFMEHLDSHQSLINYKHKEIEEINIQIMQFEERKKTLPAVVNNIPMPPELRKAEGVALLIQYIDTGRAITIQEAVNLYYQDIKDNLRMQELKKQTEYAQQQMLNSQIAAEIAAETLEETRRGADAMERAASEASRGADYASRTYWERQIEKT